MSKKLITIVATFAVVLASSFMFAGDSNACDGKTETAAVKSASAKASCSAAAAKTASAKAACSKSAATTASVKTASSGSCCATASAARTASASSCSKSASFANASSCSKSASFANASSCSKRASAAYASANGCDGNSASAASIATKADKEKYRAEKKKYEAEKKAALLALVDDLPYRESKRLVLAGSMECGRCSYNAVAGCAPLFKTADGKIYPLLDSNMVRKMRESDASEYEVSSRVKQVNGVKYLDVKAFKTL